VILPLDGKVWSDFRRRGRGDAATGIHWPWEGLEGTSRGHTGLRNRRTHKSNCGEGKTPCPGLVEIYFPIGAGNFSSLWEGEQAGVHKPRGKT